MNTVWAAHWLVAAIVSLIGIVPWAMRECVTAIGTHQLFLEAPISTFVGILIDDMPIHAWVTMAYAVIPPPAGLAPGA